MAIKYDNCKKCRSRCIHAGKDRDFVCINGVSCKITTGKSQTNADCIRAMSDEELKEFICSTLRCEFCKFEGWGGCELLDWLQQPTK